MAAAVEGAQVDFDNALGDRGPLLRRPRHRPGRQEHDPGVLLRPAARRPASAADLTDLETFTPKKMVVLGAGMMGAAIAYVCGQGRRRGRAQGRRARRRPTAARATPRSSSPRPIERGRSTPGGRRRAAGADHADDRSGGRRGRRARDRGGVRGSERSRQQVMAEIEPHLAPDALLGSNTSTLPITGLAGNVSRPADFIGLHFFSPGRQDAAAGDHPRRADHRRDAVPRARRRQADQARRRSSSTTAAASSPAA